jgi:hypothetical protein
LLLGRRLAKPGDHSALLGDGLQSERRAGNDDGQIGTMPIPPQFFNEKLPEFKLLQEHSGVPGVEVHPESP